MAALNLHLPRFRRPGPRRTLKERAKALASTTAKILRFPVSRRPQGGSGSPLVSGSLALAQGQSHHTEYGGGGGPPGGDAELAALVVEWREAFARWLPIFEQMSQAHDRFFGLKEANPDTPEAELQEQSGLAALEQADDEAGSAVDALRARIADTRATTLEGLLLKAEVAATDPHSRDGIDGDFQGARERPLSTPHLLGISIILDVLGMVGQSSRDPGADAELMQAIAAYEEHAAATERMGDAIEQAEQDMMRRRPPVPDVLLVREGDKALGLPVEEAIDPDGFLWWGYGAIRALRGAKTYRVGWRRATPEDEAPEGAKWITIREVLPEKDARKREILSAWETYIAELKDLSASGGLPAMRGEYAEAVSREAQLRRAVIELQARTLAGVMTKARMVVTVIDDEGERQGAIKTALADGGPTMDVLALSAGLDLGLLLKTSNCKEHE